MNLSSSVLADVFNRSAEHRLSAEDEREAILAARSGDDEAMARLVLAYAAVLRSQASRYYAVLGSREEAQAAALEGLVEAVHVFNPDKGTRLAGIVSRTVAYALARASEGTVAVSVPEATLRRFLRLVREAGGDVEAASRLVDSVGMTLDTFYAVATALRSWESLEGEGDGAMTRGQRDGESRSIWDDAGADPEARILAEAALSVLTEEERTVIELAYGFAEDDVNADAAIAHKINVSALGEARVASGESVTSRASVQRLRTSALARMRAALGTA